MIFDKLQLRDAGEFGSVEIWTASRIWYRKCVLLGLISCPNYISRKKFRTVAPIVKNTKNERIRLAWRVFYFLPIKKNRLQKKLELIEDRYLASIWKWLVQRSIEESMEIATPDWTFPLIRLRNADQNISRSMPDGDLQLVPTFFWRRIFLIGKN